MSSEHLVSERIHIPVSFCTINHALHTRKTDIGIALGRSIIELFKHLRLDPIIGIDESDVLPCRDLHATVTSRPQPTILAMHNLDSRILLGVFFSHITTAIR